jgi:SAM-dependent methyltransferase
MKRHLDLGCGAKPRNPYQLEALHGIDIALASPNEHFKVCNVSVQPIPFEDNHFDAVSAYDFLEHVPRVLLHPNGSSTRLPFIELMNEVWRVLKPDGLFYASTPCYPHEATFRDPTHVNVLTPRSHVYFTQPELLGAMYGFRGNFALKRAVLSDARLAYEPWNKSAAQRVYAAWRKRRGKLSHVVWEFQALK